MLARAKSTIAQSDSLATSFAPPAPQPSTTSYWQPWGKGGPGTCWYDWLTEQTLSLHKSSRITPPQLQCRFTHELSPRLKTLNDFGLAGVRSAAEDHVGSYNRRLSSAMALALCVLQGVPWKVARHGAPSYLVRAVPRYGGAGWAFGGSPCRESFPQRTGGHRRMNNSLGDCDGQGQALKRADSVVCRHLR